VPTLLGCHVHAFEALEGGSFRVSLTYDEPTGEGKTTAHTDTYHGRFVKLVANEQVVEVVEFETTDPALRGEMTITISLSDADGGTEVIAVHEGLPPGLSTTDNEAGWRSSLTKLAALVETAEHSVGEFAIITPVSRLLGAADLARTTTFYRDVLGFEVHQSAGDATAIEVVSGKARIRFGADDYAPADWDERRPIGSAIVFFETDNVDAIHAAARARRGKPSDLEKVNAIKMRVFEIRDPDGHTLWFGQSFHEPGKRAPRGLLEKALPEMPLSDVLAGVAHYRDVLGFRVNYQQADIGVMDRDDVRVILIARTERHKGIGSAYVYVHDADTLCAELRRSGANVQSDPISQPWGLREFRVLDIEGNQITFGQPFE